MAGVELNGNSTQALMNSGIDAMSQFRILSLFNKLPDSEQNAIKQKINEAPATVIGNVKAALGSNPADFLGRLEKSPNLAADIKKMVGIEDRAPSMQRTSNPAPVVDSAPRARTAASTPGMASATTLGFQQGSAPEVTQVIARAPTRRDTFVEKQPEIKASEPASPPKLSPVSDSALEEKLINKMGARAAERVIEPYKVLDSKDATMFSFMKELESRAPNNPAAAHLSEKLMEQARNNPDKAAAMDNQIAVAPNARREILEALDKKPDMGMASIDNAMSESRNSDFGTINILKLRDSLDARASGKSAPAAEKTTVVSPAAVAAAPLSEPVWEKKLEQRIGVDSAQIIGGYAAQGGPSANFNNFLKDLETKATPSNTASLIADRIYGEIGNGQFGKADEYTRAFAHNDRFAKELLDVSEKYPNATPQQIDSTMAMLHNDVMAWKDKPVPAPVAAAPSSAAPAALPAVLTPEIKVFGDRLKEKLGVAAGSDTSKDIDGALLRVQPFILESIKQVPGAALSKGEDFDQNPYVKRMQEQYQNDPQCFKKSNAIYDKDPEAGKAVMAELTKPAGAMVSPAPTPQPSPAAPAAAPGGKIDFMAEMTKLQKEDPVLADKLAGFVQQVGFTADGKMRPGFEEFGQRIFKDPELKSALTGALKGEGGSKMMEELKGQLKEHPDLFEQLNEMMDRNPRSAKKMFAQFAGGNVAGGMETFSSTVRMNMVTDMICDFLGMFSPALGNWMREKIDGLRNSKYGAMIDQFAGKMINKVTGEPEPDKKTPDAKPAAAPDTKPAPATEPLVKVPTAKPLLEGQGATAPVVTAGNTPSTPGTAPDSTAAVTPSANDRKDDASQAKLNQREVNVEDVEEPAPVTDTVIASADRPTVDINSQESRAALMQLVATPNYMAGKDPSGITGVGGVTASAQQDHQDNSVAEGSLGGQITVGQGSVLRDDHFNAAAKGDTPDMGRAPLRDVGMDREKPGAEDIYRKSNFSLS